MDSMTLLGTVSYPDYCNQITRTTVTSEHLQGLFLTQARFMRHLCFEPVDTCLGSKLELVHITGLAEPGFAADPEVEG